MNRTITKKDLVNVLLADGKLSRSQTGKAVDKIVDVIKGALAEGRTVSLSGFGTFTPVKRRERRGRNPNTGETIRIPAKTVPVFKAGRLLKNSMK